MMMTHGSPRKRFARAGVVRLVSAIALFVCLAPCLAQDVQTDRRFPEFESLEQDLDWVQWLVDSSRVGQSELDRIRRRVQSVVESARKARPTAEDAVDSLEKQLDALGAPPGKNSKKEESAEVAAKREELEDKLAVNEGYLRRIELIETRGEELMSRIARKESRAAAKEILSRDRSVFELQIWQLAANQAASVLKKVGQLGVSTLAEPGVGYYTLAALVVLMVTLLLRLALLRLIRHTTGQDETRYASALVALTANGIMPAAGLVLAFLPLLDSGKIQPPQERLMESILAAAVALLITRAWIHVALFSFYSPRLIKINRKLADPLARRLYVLTGAALLSFFLYQMERADITEPEFYQAGQLILRTIVAALFLWTLPIVTRAMQHVHKLRRESSARIIQGMYGSLFVVAWIAVPAIVALNPALVAAGYWRLADWSFYGIAGSGLLLLTLWLIRNSLRELLSWSVSVSRNEGASHSGLARGLNVWVIGILNVAVWLGAMVCLFLIWGIPYPQVMTWSTTALFAEVSLASVDISVSDILVAAAVFVGLVMLTRMVQRHLQNRVFSRAPLDAGVSNALWSITGYIGMLAAFVGSLMALGINLSQLFIVLSALSVGIGFGLQPVVHDFISGLILILERPVRLGDWIEVDGQQYSVKRIGARASLVANELASDIWIPNSRLTSTRITNWTLRGYTGYVRLVSLLRGDTDEDKASELIAKVSSGHPDVASQPEPEVVMESVDGEAMTLTLYAVIGNVARRRKVESDLRFRLKAAFREAGIKYAKQDDKPEPEPAGHAPEPAPAGRA